MREKHSTKIRRSACGQCVPCQKKLNCGKCRACCRKTMRSKCEKRKCVLLKKINGGGKCFLTLQLSRCFLQTVTTLNIGEKLDVFDSIYQNLSISSETERIKIEIQDDKSIILCEPRNRYFVDIGYTSDEWVFTRRLDVENARTKHRSSLVVEENVKYFENQSQVEDSNDSCDTVGCKNDDGVHETEALKKESLSDEFEMTDEKDFNDKSSELNVVKDIKPEGGIIHDHTKKGICNEHQDKVQSEWDTFADEQDDNILEASAIIANKDKTKTDEKVKYCVEREKEVEFKFKCISSKCGKVFQSYQALACHIKKKHCKTKEYDTVMENANIQNKIVGIKREEMRALLIQCPVCKFEYRNCYSGIDKHMISVHQHLDNFLELCKYITEQRQNYTQLSHELEDCKLCSKRIEKICYHLHIEQEHYTSELAKEVITNFLDFEKEIQESEVNTRQKSTVKNPCQYCGKLYTQNHINSHYRICKSNPGSVSYIFCHCGFRVRTEHPDKMLKHKKECKGHKIEYICDLCGKVCKSLSTKFQHRKFAHGIMGERSTEVREYKCDKCEKVYNLPCRLRRHMRSHSDERNYVCDVCGRAFKSLEHLNIHDKSLHQNKYRYHCQKCGHGVRKPKELLKHVCGRVRRKKREDGTKNVQENVINLSVTSTHARHQPGNAQKYLDKYIDQVMYTNSSLIAIATAKEKESLKEDSLSLRTLIQCSSEGDSGDIAAGNSIAKKSSYVESTSGGTELTDSDTEGNKPLRDASVKESPTILVNHNNANSPACVYAQSAMHSDSIVTQTINPNYAHLPVNLCLNQPQTVYVYSDTGSI